MTWQKTTATPGHEPLKFGLSALDTGKLLLTSFFVGLAWGALAYWIWGGSAN